MIKSKVYQSIMSSIKFFGGDSHMVRSKYSFLKSTHKRLRRKMAVYRMKERAYKNAMIVDKGRLSYRDLLEKFEHQRPPAERIENPILDEVDLMIEDLQRFKALMEDEPMKHRDEQRLWMLRLFCFLQLSFDDLKKWDIEIDDFYDSQLSDSFEFNNDLKKQVRK